MPVLSLRHPAQGNPLSALYVRIESSVEARRVAWSETSTVDRTIDCPPCTRKIPRPGYIFLGQPGVSSGMMNIRSGKETLNFLAMAAFFGGGLLLTKNFVPVSSTWDYIVLNVLTMLNGLGLCIVLALWVSSIRGGKADEQENNREKAREEMSE
jgi:hypothetical protein